MASIVNRMKPVNPTMSERIVKNKIRFANDVSMKLVAERHDLGGGTGTPTSIRKGAVRQEGDGLF